MDEFTFADAMNLRDKPDKPELQLSGEDGNAFSILSRAERALKRAGFDKNYIDSFVNEATSGDYDHLLATCWRYFEVR